MNDLILALAAARSKAAQAKEHVLSRTMLNKRAAVLAIASFAGLVFLAGVALVLTRFEAESMSESSTGISSVNDNGTQSLKFAVVGGHAEKRITLASPAESIEVRARTSVSENKRPTLRIFVDGQTFPNSVMDLKAGNTYTSASKDVSIPAGSHTVYVKCLQALSTPDPADGDCTTQRNAFIDWISFSANDADGDGVADASDNCPNAANAGQENLDGDNQGNACDADIDGDGRPNDIDYDPFDPNVQDQPNDCDITVNPGTGTIPASPAAGSVVCLHGGVYQQSATRANNELLVKSSNVTYKSYPGELAELRMGVQIVGNATSVVIGDSTAEWPEGDGLDIKLHYGPRKDANHGQCPLGCDGIATQSFHWAGDGGGIYANKITNRDPSGNTYDAGICVFMNGSTNPQGVTVDGNYIRSCGQLPRDNHEHAIYANGMQGAAITDNLIYDSADRQIQMYQHPRDVDISGNLVALGKQAGINTNEDATNIDIFQNVMVLNPDKNYYSGTNPFGGDHDLTNNCTWMANGTSGVLYDPLKVRVSGNVTVNPQLAANWDTGVVKVMNPTCAAKLPPGSRFLP